MFISFQIDRGKFLSIIQKINSYYAEAESISCQTFLENCCACLTGYLLLLCMPTHYEKVIEIFCRIIVLTNVCFSVLNVLRIILHVKMKKHSILMEYLCLIPWKKDFVV